MNASPSTPCTKVCVLDGPSGLCIGCGRTGPEIGAWLGMADAERRAVMARLPARLAALPPARTARPSAAGPAVDP